MHCSDDLPCFWQEIIFDWSITLAFVLGEGWGGGENQGGIGNCLMQEDPCHFWLTCRKN